MSAVNDKTQKLSAKSTEIVHKNVKLLNELRKVGCKVHGDAHLINDVASGDLVCERCGVVVDERMVCEEAEWRNFEGDSMADKWLKSRSGDAGNPFLSDDANLGTMVKTMDANRNESQSFASNIVKQFKRRSVDNALIHAFKEINDMGDRINLPSSVTDVAKQLYTQLYRQIKLKGKIISIDAKTVSLCTHQFIPSTQFWLLFEFLFFLFQHSKVTSCSPTRSRPPVCMWHASNRIAIDRHEKFPPFLGSTSMN